MGQPKYLLDYVGLFRSLGAREFETQFRKAVLVGIGMAGDLEDADERGGTLVTNLADIAGPQASGTSMIPPAELSSGSLVDRVWFVTKGDGGQRGAQITVGRASNNDVVIPEYSASKHHCEFRFEGGRMVIADLGSRNGTWVGTERLAPKVRRPIRDRERIFLGRFQFEFLSGPSFIQRVKTLAGG